MRRYRLKDVCLSDPNKWLKNCHTSIGCLAQYMVAKSAQQLAILFGRLAISAYFEIGCSYVYKGFCLCSTAISSVVVELGMGDHHSLETMKSSVTIEVCM